MVWFLRRVRLGVLFEGLGFLAEFFVFLGKGSIWVSFLDFCLSGWVVLRFWLFIGGCLDLGFVGVFVKGKKILGFKNRVFR